MRYLGTVLLLLASFAYGQKGQVWLHPNRGQWDSRISYKVELEQGAMFIGPKEFVYHFAEVQSHDHGNAHPGQEEVATRGHVIRTSFIMLFAFVAGYAQFHMSEERYQALRTPEKE